MELKGNAGWLSLSKEKHSQDKAGNIKDEYKRIANATYM